MKKNIIHIILLFIFTAGCGDRSLFTELAENRIKVIIKGTYESNSPRPWEYVFPEDDSVDSLVAPGRDAAPTKFMLDVAELRISDGSFSQHFANYRKTYSQTLSDDSPLFNGNGVVYENDDVRPGFEWRYLKVYTRKMMFDSAKIYTYNENRDEDDNVITDGAGNWEFLENDEDIFAEGEVEGLNFNIFQINSYYDALLYQANRINRIFPIKVALDDVFIFDDDIPETVLEIRLVIKNYVKKYELDYINESLRHAKHFYAFSDWLRDVKPGRGYIADYKKYLNDCELMGKNIIAVARSYIPGQTVTLTGNAGAERCYVVAINQNHRIGEYEISDDDRKRPALDDQGRPLDIPKYPMLDLPLDLENVLDYYLKIEKYRKDYDDFIDNVRYYDYLETGPYDGAWDAYNDRINQFGIPALVAWTETGDFSLADVPAGNTYTLYRSACSGTDAATECTPNELPGDFVDTPLASITVSPEDAGLTLPVE